MKRLEMIHFIEEAKNGVIKNPDPVVWSFVKGKFYLLDQKKIEVSVKYFCDHEKETDTLWIVRELEKEINYKCQTLLIQNIETLIQLERLIFSKIN